MSHCRLWMTIAPELPRVRTVAAALRALLGELECSEELAFMIELCVVEAVNNVVEHAYADVVKQSVELVVTLSGESIQLSITDKGTSMPEGALERARKRPRQGCPTEGGYGLGIILALMQDVSYRVTEDRNILTMSTQLGRKAA